MPEPLRSTPAKTFGRENWVFIPTIASALMRPTVAEISGASALDITRCVFTGEEPNINASTERVRMDKRAGDTDSYEAIGETSYEGGEFTTAWDPIAAAASDGKKAWEKFLNSGATVTGYIAKRENVTRATAYAAGQDLAYVMPVEIGPGTPIKKGSGAAQQSAFKATFAITGAPVFAVAILA